MEQIFNLPAFFGTQVMTLLALIAADVIFGIAAAIRTGEFEWREIVRFYETMIVPLLLGHLGFSVLVAYAAPQFLEGQVLSIVENGFPGVFWLAICRHIGASILGNMQSLLPERQ